jgi:hypothetical protein
MTEIPEEFPLHDLDAASPLAPTYEDPFDAGCAVTEMTSEYREGLETPSGTAIPEVYQNEDHGGEERDLTGQRHSSRADYDPDAEVPDLYDIVSRHVEDHYNYDEMTLEERAAILGDLPTIGRLPMPDQLPDMASAARRCPHMLQEPVTIADLHQHLSTTEPQASEISLDIFDDGQHAFRIGTTQGMIPDVTRHYVSRAAPVDFHTHPEPGAELGRLPSHADLDDAIFGERTMIIGRPDGLTYVENAPQYSVRAITLWDRYLQAKQLPQEFDTFEAYLAAYEGYINEHFTLLFTLGMNSTAGRPSNNLPGKFAPSTSRAKMKIDN